MNMIPNQSTSFNNYLPKDGVVNYWSDFYSGCKSALSFSTLKHTIEWKNDEIYMFGKKIVTQRKTALYGSTGIVYTYSNATKTALPWTRELLAIKKDLELHLGVRFNTCLLNFYHDGSEGMGWHSDDEKEMEKDGVIASLSVGAERKFSFKHKITKEKIDIMLQSGSLLVMKGETQRYWLHQLPKTKKVDQPRINLTFRKLNSNQ